MNGCTFRDLEDMKTGDASTEDIFREFWGVENNEDHQYTGLDKLRFSFSSSAFSGRMDRMEA